MGRGKEGQRRGSTDKPRRERCGCTISLAIRRQAPRSSTLATKPPPYSTILSLGVGEQGLAQDAGRSFSCSSEMTSGGARRMMLPCVGLVRKLRRARSRHSSQAEQLCSRQ